MNELANLKKPKGATKRRVRVGRGQSSGLGKTAGRGGKGQKARTGNMHFEGFEGGQSPLQRRLPKRGFTNIHRVEYQLVNLEQVAEKALAGSVGAAELVSAGLIKDAKGLIKVLGNGELKAAITLHAHKFSGAAKQKIEAAGGKAVEIVLHKAEAAK